MKFKCGKTPEEKQQEKMLLELGISAEAERLLNWHRKFAWWPKHFDNGYCVWLGYYNRRLSPKKSSWPCLEYNRENSEDWLDAQAVTRRYVRCLCSGHASEMRAAEKWFADKGNWEYSE